MFSRVDTRQRRRNSLAMPPRPWFRPRLIDALKDYGARRFGRDCAAGMTVGVLALPLAMAFAIASGVKPEAGIYTAIIAGFLISALGGSRVQIGGPTGAFIVIVYGIVAQYGFANLLICTMMAGAMLLAMGLAGVGTWIRLIPVSVITGFTKGIAVLILLSLVRDFLGLNVDALPSEFFAKVTTLWYALPTVNLESVALGLACIAVIMLWPKKLGAVPGSIVALVCGTVAAVALDLNVETIGSRFGGIPEGFPGFVLPEITLDTLRHLIRPAITIALLGAIESLLSATVADRMIDDRHDPNQELMAQGIANIAAPLSGGFCATGAIARTSTNVRMGATTPFAGIVHALTILAIVLLAAPVAKHVPLAVLSAILALIAWNMGEWREFGELRRYTFNYRAVLLSTFVLTVVIDLTVAVEVGMALAALFFITRVSGLTEVIEITPAGSAAGVRVYTLFGSLFFGSTSKVEPLLALAEPADTARVVILEMHKTINVDTTGLDMLDTLHRRLAKNGKALVIAGANEQPLSLFRRSGFAERLGSDNLVADLPAAMARAEALLEKRKS